MVGVQDERTREQILGIDEARSELERPPVYRSLESSLWSFDGHTEIDRVVHRVHVWHHPFPHGDLRMSTRNTNSTCEFKHERWSLTCKILANQPLWTCGLDASQSWSVLISGVGLCRDRNHRLISDLSLPVQMQSIVLSWRKGSTVIEEWLSCRRQLDINSTHSCIHSTLAQPVFLLICKYLVFSYNMMTAFEQVSLLIDGTVRF